MIAQLDRLYIRLRWWKLWSRLLAYVFFEGRPVTTRGRWINPAVFALFSVVKKLPQLRAIERPVFILGTGRSGTTVLGMVLSMHREVAFLNEPKALWHALHPHEDLIGSYSLGAARYRLGPADATPEVRRIARRLFGAYLALSCSRRVLDKYPELIFRVPFVKAIFPDAKFLFLVRNGWDTCSSIESWSRRLGTKSGGIAHDWWGVNRRKWDLLVEQIVPEHHDLAPHVHAMKQWDNHVWMAAVEWIVTMREGLRLMSQYPEDVLRVTYEQLCADPTEELDRIVAHAKLRQRDETFLKYASSVLVPTLPKRPFALDASIERAFHDTMRILGYS